MPVLDIYHQNDFENQVVHILKRNLNDNSVLFFHLLQLLSGVICPTVHLVFLNDILHV